MKSNEHDNIYYINWQVGTSEIKWFSFQKSTKRMPTIQTCFWMLQMTEHIKKWSKMVSEGRHKIVQKSSKIHPGTFQGSFECMCVPLDHQNGAKIFPRTSKVSQNGDPRTLKGDKHQQYPMTNPATKNYILNSAPLISILEILQILLILSVCKSAVNWLPEGPAAGAKP